MKVDALPLNEDLAHDGGPTEVVMQRYRGGRALAAGWDIETPTRNVLR